MKKNNNDYQAKSGGLKGIRRSLRIYGAMARSYLGFVLKKERAPLPCFFNIDPSSRCNLRCVFCPQSDPPGTMSFGAMDLGLFERILGQIERYTVCAGISLFLSGEPLLNRNLDRMIEMVRERFGMGPLIATNATLLSREMSIKLLDAGVGLFMIDFCADREHFERMCPPAEWQKVHDNIRGLAELIRERGDHVVVKLKDLDWRGETAAERDESMARLKGLFGEAFPFEYISYNLHNWAGEFAEKAEENYGYKGGRRGSKLKFHPCSHLWLMMNIHYDGKVSICCRDIMQEAVIGDFREEELPEIWNGDRMRRVRRLMASGNYRRIPICARCDRIWTGSYSGGSPLRIAQKFLRLKLRKFNRR